MDIKEIKSIAQHELHVQFQINGNAMFAIISGKASDWQMELDTFLEENEIEDWSGIAEDYEMVSGKTVITLFND